MLFTGKKKSGTIFGSYDWRYCVEYVPRKVPKLKLRPFEFLAASDHTTTNDENIYRK